MLTDEELEQIRRSLMMAPSLPAGIGLRLLEAIHELLAERSGGCCRPAGETGTVASDQG